MGTDGAAGGALPDSPGVLNGHTNRGDEIHAGASLRAVARAAAFGKPRVEQAIDVA